MLMATLALTVVSNAVAVLLDQISALNAQQTLCLSLGLASAQMAHSGTKQSVTHARRIAKRARTRQVA